MEWGGRGGGSGQDRERLFGWRPRKLQEKMG